jgi:predicted DNA binding protein
VCNSTGSFFSETLVVTVPWREVLFEVTTALRAVGASISIGWLTSVDGGDTVEIDADAITETQRETLEAAIEAGCYSVREHPPAGI